jgi:hypothetical protein
VVKIAVLIDGDKVQRFALDCLDAISGTDEITIFSCTNSRWRRSWFRHGVYYLLNLAAVRNGLTRPVPIASGRKRIAHRVEFASDYDGVWQKLPPDVVGALASGGFDVVLKFGMGLLRVPDARELPVPILSYHHGDPDHYRGRPAGFWEIVDGAPVLGQVVQVIGNRLDAGRVVAFAETRVIPWSYRATLMEAFRHSPLIINAAIRNAVDGAAIDKRSEGRNCRLPSSGQTTLFTLKMASRFVTRLLYGAFIEKGWRVSTAPGGTKRVADLVAGEPWPPSAAWTDLPIARGYSIYADPFFTTQPPGIVLEALDARTGIGRILFIDGDEQRIVTNANGHMSYPSVATIAGRELVLPEMASWSEPRLYSFRIDQLESTQELKIEGDPRLTDATLFDHRGRVFLFANRKDIGSNTLYLWSGETLDEELTLHPASPIRISPEGARMGGALLELDGRLIRFGQDLTRGYGDGLFAFEIESLTLDAYKERLLGRIGFSDRKGPHTINANADEIVFDWYRDRLSLLAGLRRIAGRRRVGNDGSNALV